MNEKFDLDTIEKFLLKIVPRLEKNKSVTWSCGRETYGYDCQVSEHYVYGYVSLNDAILAWMKLYGPTPKRGLLAGLIVKDTLLGNMTKDYQAGIVHKVGKWYAVVEFKNRGFKKPYPLCRLEIIDNALYKSNLTEEELKEISNIDCDQEYWF